MYSIWGTCQTGNKGYVGRSEEYKERNILDYTIPKDNMQPKKGTWYQSAKKQRPKIEGSLPKQRLTTI